MQSAIETLGYLNFVRVAYMCAWTSESCQSATFSAPRAPAVPAPAAWCTLPGSRSSFRLGAWGINVICARQVDLIVCFDTSKSPIRNIQRMGRTGRHRPGRVVYILASGKEADDYQSNLMVQHNSTPSQGTLGRV